MNESNPYIKQVEEYVSGLLRQLPTELCYHNLNHTQEVVKACEILAEELKFSSVNFEIVVIAAWFHDSGHIKTYYGHEEAGMIIAQNFLNQIKYPQCQTNEVLNCIMATKYPQTPQNELQKVLCDADMFHLSFKDYENRSMALKKEIELMTDTKIPLQKWCDQNMEFLQHHCYFTSYGKKFLKFLKDRNLKKHIQNYCKQ